MWCIEEEDATCSHCCAQVPSADATTFPIGADDHATWCKTCDDGARLDQAAWVALQAEMDEDSGLEPEAPPCAPGDVVGVLGEGGVDA